MKAMSIKYATVCVVALFVLMIPGCSPGIDGKYQDASGMMTLEIKSGKAIFGMGGEKKEVAMKQEGDKITLTSDNQPVVFTRQSDGSLQGDNIKLTKKD